MAGGRRERVEDAPDPEGEGQDRLPECRVRAGRQGPVRLARRRVRVPAARIHGPGDQKDRLPDAGHRRRRRLRPVLRRQDARLRHQREGGQRPPPAGHGLPPRAAGPEAAAGRRLGSSVAPGRRSRRVHDGDRPRRRGRVFLGRPCGQARALDGERAGRPERRDLRRARARVLEELRRPGDHGFSLPAQRLEVPRQAAGRHRDPRRARGSVEARLSGSLELHRQRARRGDRAARTSAVPRVTGRRFSSSTTATCGKALTRTSAPSSTGFGPGRTSTRTASWSEEAATAAT